MTNSYPWNLETLITPPRVFPALEFSEPGVQALFYETLPWQGRPTRTFAWLGLPERSAREKVPGIVLVHGGGGTAFAEWVRLWTARGYAAIAMDTCGCTPGGEHSRRPRHEHGGPPSSSAWENVDRAVEDHWVYHAVADVILAHSLLRALPEVDPARIGITGISWGGYLTCIAAGLDARLAFAAPIYGCGFVTENESWPTRMARMGEPNAALWRSLWEPARYLPEAHMPMLWINGTNDLAYPLHAHQKSYRLPLGPRTICIPVRMVHGHGGPGENPPEIHAFAESVVSGGPPLLRVIPEESDPQRAAVSWSGPAPIHRAELVYTLDSGPWNGRFWQSTPATCPAKSHMVEAVLPAGTTAYYFNLTDVRGLMVSSEFRAMQG